MNSPLVHPGMISRLPNIRSIHGLREHVALLGESQYIVRIERESMTANVFSFRVRCEEAQLHDRVVDDYFIEFRCHSDSSDRPLSLGGLI